METARKRVSGFGFQVSGFRFRVSDSNSQILTRNSKLETRNSRALTRNSKLETRNSPGFTLLEVLVALAVLAVALVSLLGLQNRNLLLSMQAERLSTGTLLVREMLTRTQLEGPDAGRVTSGDFAETHPGQYPEFRWHRTIRPAQLDGLWEIQVGVTWGNRADERAELTLFTPLS